MSAETVAEALGLPLLGTLVDEQALTVAAERGDPPARSARSPLAQLCRQVLADVLTADPGRAGGGLGMTVRTEAEPAILEPLRDRLAGLGRSPTPADVAAAMRADGQMVSDTSVIETVEALRRNSVGGGPLEPLLREPGVTDVLVNGPDQVFVDRGTGLEPSGIRFADDTQVRRLAQRLAASVGRRLDDAAPFVDARLADGTRVHAVLGLGRRTRNLHLTSRPGAIARSAWTTASPPAR